MFCLGHFSTIDLSPAKNDEVIVSDTWIQWEGQTVGGDFRLVRYLGGSERSAAFLTEHREQDSTLPGTIKLVPSSAQKAELRLARWRETANLSHPNLIRLFESGRSELGGVPLVYIVMEMADENLGEVLAERALTTEEARKMLEGLLDVLGYLHSKGFVHGHVKPSNILGVGEQLKFSSDRVWRVGKPLANPGNPDGYDPPEYARGIIPVPEKTSTAADVWALGMTLVESLTGNRPARAAVGQNLVLPENLPQPFAEIATHCLRPAPQDRWTVAQIADCLAGRTPITASVRTPTRAAAQRVADVTRHPPTGSVGKRSGFGSFAAVAAAVAVLAIIVAFAWMRYRPQAEQSQTRQSQTAQASPVPDSSSPAVRDTPSPAPPSAPSAADQERFNSAIGLSPESPDTNSPTPSAPAVESARPNRARPLQEAVDNDSGRGEVTRQVIPQVSHSALDTIQGTVRVGIKVDVDRSGGVSNAAFESEGPSKYFARMAMQAAQNWKFKPAETSGRQVPSTWELQFEFTRDGAEVVPTRTAP